MKYLIAPAVLAVALFGGNAYAADMPLKAPAPRAAPAYYSWAGFYAGVDGGANLGKFSPFFNTGDVEDPTRTEVNLKDNSAFVGGHVGYNAQQGMFVFGPEVGIQYWGFKSEAELVPAVVVAPATKELAAVVDPAVLLQQKIDWLFYANAKFGIEPFTGALLYVDGGAAFAHVKGSVINVAVLGSAFEQSVLGWNVGVGAEVRLNENWSIGAKYTHFDFGNVQAANPVVALIGLEPAALRVDQIRGSLNYRFTSQ
jgi:opacity protein-like surface antigen